MRDNFSEVSSLELVCRSLTRCGQATLICKEMECITNFGDMYSLQVVDQDVLCI